jgi:catechol 2,3-dioxygenase-like lactoylglutathione lyase family enzyme
VAIHLDHVMVPCRNRAASAKLLADLLGVPWAETGVGPFSPVYMNDGLTLDFDETDEPFPTQHCCFRVGQEEFDAILGRIRAAGIPYRSTPHGPVDMQVNTQHGGSIVYWNQPDGHVWEVLTVGYARQSRPAAQLGGALVNLFEGSR